MSKIPCVKCDEEKPAVLLFMSNEGPICGNCLRKETKRKTKVKAKIRKK